jgi:hypothetical protein
MAHIWYWLENFMGVHFGQNSFSTHMYNFWSGFGSDITEFAIVGTILTVYRQHLKDRVNILNLVKKEEEKRFGSNSKKD